MQHHAERVSEAVREELTEIIGFELADPRLAAVDVTEVTVSPDSRDATIRVSLGGDERQQAQALAALDHARHYLRHELARRLNLRRIPDLHFHAAQGPGHESRVELLLRRAKKKRASTDQNHT